jgi:hypothetical protein
VNGWVRFEEGFKGGPAVVLLRLSGLMRGEVSRLVQEFLWREWCEGDLDAQERQDAELIAGLFVASLPVRVEVLRLRRGWSTANGERVLVRLHEGAAREGAASAKLVPNLVRPGEGGKRLNDARLPFEPQPKPGAGAPRADGRDELREA